MNKNLKIGLIIVVLIAGGWVSLRQYMLRPRPDDVVKGEQPDFRRGAGVSPMEKNSDAALQEGERYGVYSKTFFDQEVNSRRVLFFYASWCPTCRPTDADLMKNKNRIPQDAVVFRVNYNDPETDQEEKDLAKKYAVTYQHTFVQIDKSGKEITKWNGGKTEELLANIKQ